MKNYIHILINLREASFEDLNNEKLVTELLDSIVNFYKLKVIKKDLHLFKPQGISCFSLLEESHISIHTCPEKGKAYLDLFASIKDEFEVTEIKKLIYSKIKSNILVLQVFRDE